LEEEWLGSAWSMRPVILWEAAEPLWSMDDNDDDDDEHDIILLYKEE